MEPYHIADSNCQQFAALVWHALSLEVYPNPSSYNSGGFTSGEEDASGPEQSNEEGSACAPFQPNAVGK